LVDSSVANGSTSRHTRVEKDIVLGSVPGKKDKDVHENKDWYDDMKYTELILTG